MVTESTITSHNDVQMSPVLLKLNHRLFCRSQSLHAEVKHCHLFTIHKSLFALYKSYEIVRSNRQECRSLDFVPRDGVGSSLLLDRPTNALLVTLDIIIALESSFGKPKIEIDAQA